MDDSGTSSRPSLYLAFRLAGLVREFRHRLQERVLVRKRSKNPFGNSPRRGLRLRATSNAEKALSPPRLTVKTEAVSPVEHEFNGQWANSLLHEIDRHADRKTSPLATIAADDKLFLSNSTSTLVDTVSPTTSPQHAAYLFDLSSLLIDRLDVFRSQQPTKPHHSSCGPSDLRLLLDATFIANLLHLLLRLQRKLFQVLINQTIQQIEEITRHWREYWQQQRKLGNNWFNEWPDGRRPLNTTWPWNIRPSLVVLWGVCWMFYNNKSTLVEDSEDFFQDQGSDLSLPHLEEDEEGLYNRTGDTSQLWDQAAAADALVGYNNVFGAGRLGLGLTGDGGFGASAVSTPGEDAAVALPDPVTSHTEPSQSLFDRGTFGVGANETKYPYISELNYLRPPGPIYRHHHVAGATPTSVQVSSNAPVVSEAPLVETQGFLSSAEPPYVGQSEYNPAQLPPTSDFPLFVNTTPYATHSYLSPSSPFPSQMLEKSPFMVSGTDINTTGDGRGHPPKTYSNENLSPRPALAINQVHPEMAAKPRLSVRRDREPPKNESGQMYCDHESCRENPPTFRRKCEWNKHMDKHDRPYKCKEPGCDKILGFTYAGGLLRHQREVHKKNAKANCPYPDCNRSTGAGFTRQENLKEHLRRRHRVLDISPDTPLARTPDVEAMPAPSVPALLSPASASKKRKRSTDQQTPSTATSDDGSEYSVDPREEVKRLRLQLEDRDRRVEELEKSISNLQRIISQVQQ